MMPKLTRKQTVLAKIESTYGTDPTPTGSANAILVRNLTVNPIAAETVGRDVIRSYLGESDQLLANKRVEMTFEIEMAGAGAAGTAPAYGPLLRACAMAETTVASAVTGTAQAGASGTITLAAGASSTDDIYNGLIITLTGGTGSGQAKRIVDYVGSTKVATVIDAWGTTPDGTSTYSIGAGVTYKPVSDNMESVTIYVNVDGVLHKLLGARGNVEMNITAQQIPVFNFSFTGVYVAATDTAAPTTVYTAWQTPLVANVSNTPTSVFFGQDDLVVESMTLNVNNTVNFRALIGDEYVQITDRRSNGQLVFEATPLADLDVFTAAADNTTGIFEIIHGTAAGNRVALSGRKVDLGNPTYGDSNGIVMINCPVAYIPYAGNDEFVITVT
jgi:hypothetical protein